MEEAGIGQVQGVGLDHGVGLHRQVAGQEEAVDQPDTQVDGVGHHDPQDSVCHGVGSCPSMRRT